MSTSPRSLLSFKTIGPQDSTSEYREEKPVFFHPADLARDSFHNRKGKFMRARKPTIATVNVASIPDAITFQLERIDRSNKRADRRIYPKVNELSIALDGCAVNIVKVRKTPRQLLILCRAIHRGRLQKFDTGYLTKCLNLYMEGYEYHDGCSEEEELPPRNTDDDSDDSDDEGRPVVDRWDYGGYGW